MERPAERPVPRRLIELSHQIRHGMVTYPGLPGPELSDYLPRSASPARHGPGTEFHIGPISMVANTGTCLDSPFHRVAGATGVAGRSVLVHTGFDRYWGTPSSPLPPPAAWPSSRPHWPASTRSTSTTPAS